MPFEPSHYDLLGIDPRASAKEIKAAFYRAVKNSHPDIDSSPAAHDLTVDLVRAYHVLGDAERRLAYDRECNFTPWSLRDAISQPATTLRHAQQVRPAPVARLSGLRTWPSGARPAAGVRGRPGPGARLAPDAALFEQQRRRLRRRGVAVAATALSFAVGAIILILLVFNHHPPQRPAMAAADAPATTERLAPSTTSLCLSERSGPRRDPLPRRCARTSRYPSAHAYLDVRRAAASDSISSQAW